jgi:Leucine-rich repeat (LRR) protein
MSKTIIYKNDLKFMETIDLERSEFESEAVKNIYEEHKNKPPIEMRITNSKMENYDYLDLSRLSLDDELLENLFKLERITNILKKIKYLDLSNNQLSRYPNIRKYRNITVLSINNNKIGGIISDNNLTELTCDDNNITEIKSSTMTILMANNNKITKIDVPKVEVLHINNNKIKEIGEYKQLEYLECMNNEIININNLEKLHEIYIANNKLENISNLPNLTILNCINNPIKKIIYFEKVNLILSSTPFISSQYKISNITKMDNDYLINLYK